MHDQSTLAAAASFVAMWTVMMVAMMLPSLVPMLARYRRAIAGQSRPNARTALAALGYFSFWAVIGLLVFPLDAAISAPAMRHPIAIVAIVLIAGCVQLTSWKARQLACCRRATLDIVTTAWRHGLQLGVECARCCGNLMVVMLVAGLMDLRVMAVVTAAITIERFAPARIARIAGFVIIATLLGVQWR